MKAQQHEIRITKDAIALVGIDEPPNAKDPKLPKMEYTGLNTYKSGNSRFPSPWSQHGTLDAVYGLLRDECGVAFLDPTDDGTTIESRPTLELPLGVRKVEPWVACRDIGNFFPEPWQKRDTGFLPWRRAAYIEAYKPGRFTEAVINSQNELFLLRARFGGERAHANHSFGTWYDRFLNTNSAIFVAYHPEYFGQKPSVSHEKRYIEAVQIHRNRPLQLCYSNPDVIAQVIRDARDYFDHGGAPVYDQAGKVVRYDPLWGEEVFCLEPMDNSHFCNCDRCRAQYPKTLDPNSWVGTNHNEYWFRFVNTVAKEVKKTHPAKRISTLAYMSHTAPPSFKMEDNVEVHFCHHGNRTPHAVEMNRRLESQLKGWYEKLAPGHLGIWFYNGFPFMRLGFPGFFLHEHARQYRDWIHALKIRRTVFHCGCHDYLENYAISHWLWNPLADVEKLRDRYLKSYGPAEPQIRAIVDLMEERYCNLKHCPIGLGHQDTKQAWSWLCPQDVQERIDALMEQALAAPRLEGAARRRTMVFKRMYVDYIDVGATFQRELPQTKAGVTATQRRYLPAHSRYPKPLSNDLLGCAPEFTIAAFNEDAAAVKPLKKTTAFNDKRDGVFYFDRWGLTNVLYFCSRPVPSLKRLRVTVHGGDTMRARALVTPVGLKGGKWLRLADEVGRELCPGGKSTLDFRFEPGAAPTDLEAIGIVESGSREKFNAPRLDAIEVESREELRLALGVISDIHISPQNNTNDFVQILKWYRERGVDGVILAGDIADTGRICELEDTAQAWFSVFPGNRSPLDGRPVEQLFIYGNHDTYYGWKKPKAPGLINLKNLGEVWEKAFHEPYAMVRKKTVKGYDVILADWEGFSNGLIEPFYKDYKKNCDPKKLLFHVQHGTPSDTISSDSHDRNVAARSLAMLTNAVVFSGDSHFSMTDEQIWQGPFTSIGCGSIRQVGLSYFNYENTRGSRCGKTDNLDHPREMKPLTGWDGHQGMLVKVYDSRVVIERHDFINDCSLADDWVLPLDGSRPYAPEAYRSRRVAPEFAAGSKIEIAKIKVGKNEKYQLTFPRAQTVQGCRVFEYVVTGAAADAPEKSLFTRRYLAHDFYQGESCTDPLETLLVDVKSFPAAVTNGIFSIRPVEAFGKQGAAIARKTN